jgi:hypothetical protein
MFDFKVFPVPNIVGYNTIFVIAGMAIDKNRSPLTPLMQDMLDFSPIIFRLRRCGD